MARLEEVLSEFRKGAKIRATHWDKNSYIEIKNGEIVDCKGTDVGDLPFYKVMDNDWEFYREPEPDWQYIVNNKCLCWFWDEEDDNKVLGLLIRFPEKKDQFQYKTNIHCGAKYFKNCRPVRKNEINFYEDRKDVAED